jgi:hypothetical protein
MNREALRCGTAASLLLLLYHWYFFIILFSAYSNCFIANSAHFEKEDDQIIKGKQAITSFQNFLCLM